MYNDKKYQINEVIHTNKDWFYERTVNCRLLNLADEAGGVVLDIVDEGGGNPRSSNSFFFFHCLA